MNFTPELSAYFIVLPLTFFAGLVDAMAGGGGLISVPAYLAAGLPPQLALGTNKLSSAAGTTLATWRYLRHRYIDLKTALLSAVFAIVGSHLGARSVLLVDADLFRWALVILLPLVAILTLLNKDRGLRDLSHTFTGPRRFVGLVLTSTLLGFYDGIFGPGTGTFLIIFFMWFLRYDLVKANGNTKLVNLATNLSALFTFIAADQVAFRLGGAAALSSIAGNLLGSQLVVRRGNHYIKPMLLFALALLLGKIVMDLL